MAFGSSWDQSRLKGGLERENGLLLVDLVPAQGQNPETIPRKL